MFIEQFDYEDDEKYSKIKEELDYITFVCWSIILFIILLIISISAVHYS